MLSSQAFRRSQRFLDAFPSKLVEETLDKNFIEVTIRIIFDEFLSFAACGKLITKPTLPILLRKLLFGKRVSIRRFYSLTFYPEVTSVKFKMQLKKSQTLVRIF